MCFKRCFRNFGWAVLALLLAGQVSCSKRNPTENNVLTLVNIRAKAEKGDAEAQYELGKRCFKGEGTIRDVVEAVGWYRKAAEQNHASAQFNLGILVKASRLASFCNAAKRRCARSSGDGTEEDSFMGMMSARTNRLAGKLCSPPSANKYDFLGL